MLSNKRRNLQAKVRDRSVCKTEIFFLDAKKMTDKKKTPNDESEFAKNDKNLRNLLGAVTAKFEASSKPLSLGAIQQNGLQRSPSKRRQSKRSRTRTVGFARTSNR